MPGTIKRLTIASTAFTAVLFLPANANAKQASFSIDGRLRSAVLLHKLPELEYQNQHSTEALALELQAHFDAVLAFLTTNESRSIDLALDRLEKRQGIQWSSKQREYWRRYLSRQRRRNLEVLTDYQQAGNFPLNEGHASQAVPIFVDNHDTACAVGYLMRESGWSREVELIATTNLFVYVSQIRSGHLVNWLLQSGLTQEEAAIIQPGYIPPDPDHPLGDMPETVIVEAPFADVADGGDGPIVRPGIRYENFSLRGLRFPNSSTFTPIASNSQGITATTYLGSAGGYIAYGCCDSNILALSPTVVLDEYGYPAYGEFVASTGPREQDLFLFSFDVEVLSPGYGIDTALVFAPSAAHSLVWGNEVAANDPLSNVSVDSLIVEVGTAVEDLSEFQLLAQQNNIGNPTATLESGAEYYEPLAEESPASFSARRSFTVHTLVQLGQNASVSVLVHDFRIVPIPEPTSFASLLIGLACFALPRQESSAASTGQAE